MRWVFCNPDNAAEMNAKQAVLERIDAWWNTFAGKTEALYDFFHNKAGWDLPGWMHEHLRTINQNLMWEYGPAVNSQGHRLIITPECEHYLRPMVTTILERAPSISGWEFYPYRLSSSLNEAKEAVLGATGIDISKWRCKASVGDGNVINLTYLTPSLIKKDEDEKTGAGFMTTEWLIGEELLDKWIGSVEVKPISHKGIMTLFSKSDTDTAPHIDQINSTVKTLIDSVKAKLPNTPFYIYGEDATWSAIKLTPRELPDYPGRKDLFTATTGLIDMWKSAHCGMFFSSERFTKNREIFCYIKIEHSEEFDRMDLEKRDAVESSLNNSLNPAGLGGVCGGGTGTRYCYIDLALLDLKKGIPATVDVLRKAGVSRRSWIQFFDTELSHEWIGIYEDSPAPPSIS